MVPPTAVVVAVEGELNALTCHELKARLASACHAGLDVVVDLGATTFIDSSGLSALVSGLKQAKLGGREMLLAHLPEQARMIFEITTAYRLFDLFETVDAALASLGSGAARA